MICKDADLLFCCKFFSLLNQMKIASNQIIVCVHTNYFSSFKQMLISISVERTFFCFFYHFLCFFFLVVVVFGFVLFFGCESFKSHHFKCAEICVLDLYTCCVAKNRPLIYTLRKSKIFFLHRFITKIMQTAVKSCEQEKGSSHITCVWSVEKWKFSAIVKL